MLMCALDLCPMYSRCCYSERRREGEGEREGGEGREGGRGRERGREGEGERELSIEFTSKSPSPNSHNIIHTQL